MSRIPRIAPDGGAIVKDKQSGKPDRDAPIWVWSNQWMQHCRFCGVAREGTAGAVVAHSRKCQAIVDYTHSRAEGVAPDAALRIAVRLLAEREENAGSVSDFVEKFLDETACETDGSLHDEALDGAAIRISAIKAHLRSFQWGEDPHGILLIIDDVVTGLRDIAEALVERADVSADVRTMKVFSSIEEARRAVCSKTVVIDQPIGNCDGSREYAYDKFREDGRGEKLQTRCPGCRACS